MGDINDVIAQGPRPPQVDDPQVAYAKAQQLVTQRQQQAANAQQLQIGALNLQNARRDANDQDVIRNAFMESNGDPAQMRKLAIQSGASPKAILALDAHNLDIRTKLATLDKDTLENTAKAHDAMRGALLTYTQNPNMLEKTNGWTNFVQQQVDQKHITQDEASQYLTYPGDAKAKLIANGLATGSVLAKEEIDARGAAARELTAQTGATKEQNEAPGQIADSTQKQVAAVAPQLEQAFKTGGMDAVNAQLDQMPRGVARRFEGVNVAGGFNDAALTPDQKVTTDQAKATLVETTRRDTNTNIYQTGELAATRQRNALALKEYQQKYGDVLTGMNPNNLAIAQKLAVGEFDPAQLGRMPGKEQIIAGAIAINPNWTPQVYATKKSFTDPEKTQAKNLGTISRIVGHIGQFEQNSQSLGFAPAYAAGMNLTGDQNQLNEDAHAISAELEKLVSGGVGTEGQIKSWQKSLHSPTAGARQQAVDEISRLIGSQYEGMNQTYKAATGSDLPIGQYVTGAGQQWMKAKGINVQGVANPQQPGAPAKPATGAIVDGYTFLGGDPADQKRWKKN